MNFNVYVEDRLAQEIERFAQEQGKKRNAIVREALELWIAQHKTVSWPEVVLNYEGEEDSEGITFEAYRDELLVPVETKF